MSQLELKNEIVDFTCNGNCSNCGECCSDILPLDDFEINKIKKYIKQHKTKENIHIPFAIRKKIDLTCPFRDNINKKCTIYAVRPDICKSFICSTPYQKIQEEKQLFYRNKKAVSMRNIFFNGPAYEEILLMIINQINKK